MDVGSNVGYSLIYWAAKFPSAVIDAFEPHPGHLEILRRSLRVNRLDRRVEVHSVAAGSANGICELVDAGTTSAIAKDNAALCRTEAGRLQIPVVDFFEAIRDGQIDLLKLDCEGAEYGILMDPHFSDLGINNLVMEWHATEEHPDARHDLARRLHDLGWKTQPGTIENVELLDDAGFLGAGVLWGFRRASSTRIS